MKTLWTAALMAAAFILRSTPVHAQATSPPSPRDTGFIQSICEDSLLVQRMGELASERSENSRVKLVCHDLAVDYRDTRRQFVAAAQAMGLPVASDLSPRASRAIEKLRDYSGHDFDLAALRALIKSEQAVLRKIQDQSNFGDNPSLKQVAASSLPRLQDDIYRVVTLQSDLTATAVNTVDEPDRGLASQP